MSGEEGDQRPQRRAESGRRRTPCSVPPPAKMNIHHGSNVQEWKRFKRAWKNFEIASKLQDETPQYKCAVFQSCIGEEAAELIDGFIFKEDEDEDNIDDVINKFNEFFVGETNEVYEAYIFNRREQDSSESTEMYVAELRKLAKTCNYGDS